MKNIILTVVCLFVFQCSSYALTNEEMREQHFGFYRNYEPKPQEFTGGVIVNEGDLVINKGGLIFISENGTRVKIILKDNGIFVIIRLDK